MTKAEALERQFCRFTCTRYYGEPLDQHCDRLKEKSDLCWLTPEQIEQREREYKFNLKGKITGQKSGLKEVEF